MCHQTLGTILVRGVCLILCLGVCSSRVTSQVTIGNQGIRVPGEGGRKPGTDSVSRSGGCLSAGSVSGAEHATRLQGTTSYNQRLLLEEQEWQQRLRVSAAIYVISADNAFAEPGGRVLLGQQLANRYMQQGPDYALQALGYVAAHEFGHQLQFRFNNDLPSGPATELQADAIAGYWAGMRLAEQVEQGLPREQADAIKKLEKDAAYAIGDYVFNSPQHHGTPAERREAVSKGLEAGYSRLYGSNFRSDVNGAKLLEGTRQIVAEVLHRGD
jgi:hypothetical protein